MRKHYRELTPEKVWKRYGNDVGVEYFISNFLVEGFKLDDIYEMCRRYITDIIYHNDGMISTDEKERVIDLLYEYIKTYIDNQGGIDKLKLLTEDELDKLWNEEVKGFFKDLIRLERRLWNEEKQKRKKRKGR